MIVATKWRSEELRDDMIVVRKQRREIDPSMDCFAVMGRMTRRYPEQAMLQSPNEFLMSQTEHRRYKSQFGVM